MADNVRVDVQAVFLQQPSKSELIRLSGRMSKWRNTEAPSSLTPEQIETIKNEPQMKEARRLRDDKFTQIK